jgi:carbonic anhydrase
VQGHRHDLEFHFVHETEKNDLAVIGILCNAADDVSDEVKEFEDSLKASLKSDDGVVINPNLLFNSVNTTK